MKSYLSMLAAWLLCAFGASAADVVTSSPTPLQVTSENVSIFFHADQGNKGMMGLAADAEVYAHTGVITNESLTDGDWKHGPAEWGDNDPKYKLTYVDTDLWRLDLGTIAEYYGLEEGEVPYKLAFVFRTGDKKKEGKDVGGADIMLPVAGEGFQLSLTNDMTNAVILGSKTTVTFTVSSTAPATLSLSVDGTLLKQEENVTTLSASYDFASTGNYTVVAKGQIDSEVKEETFIVCNPVASAEATYPGGTPKMGTVRNADGTVTFCIAAPKKKNMMLIPSWCDFEPRVENVMNYQDDGDNRYFWINVADLDPDRVYTYYFLADNLTKVADPYAKLILDPYNDKYISEDVYPDMPQIPAKLGTTMLSVYHENINKYDWQVTDFKAPRKQDLIIYELLLRDFTGTEGEAKGDGTLRLAMEKIPYLKALGVNAIELLPINEFNGNLSWGYNPNFYFAPDKAYGTPDDYKEFIDLCHENGIAVILDLVFNQSDGLHPWCAMYGSASNSPFYNRSAPHAYNVLNDWNQDHPLVEQQWKDCVQYWLSEYKVDGFRFDLVKGLGDNDSYGTSSEANTNKYNATRVARMTRIHAAMAEVNPDAFCINENLAGAQEENEMAADGQLNWANVNNSSCQYAMGYTSEASLSRFDATKDSRTRFSTVSYAESHDEERMGYKQVTWGAAGVKNNPEAMKARIASVGAQMILSPGAHMIWQFSELGNQQTTKNSSGNDTGNKIVDWNALNDEYTLGCYYSWCDFGYLRTKYADLFGEDADYKAVLSGWTAGRTICTSKDDREIVVVLNPNTTAGAVKTITNVGFKLDDNAAYELASCTYGTRPEFDAAAKTVTLPSNSYAIYIRKGMEMSGVDSLPATSEVKVYTSGSDIVILGDYTRAEAYTLSGARAPLTGLASGIYLVRVDDKTFKVIVD